MNDKPQQDKPTFEEALGQLEEVVRQLETGNLGLDEALKCYETGVKQLRHCHRVLDEAERKIELLVAVDDKGKPQTQPFDDAELTLEEKSAARTERRGVKKKVKKKAAARKRPDDSSLF